MGQGLCLELREGWCVGLSGTDTAAEMALTELVQAKRMPSSGQTVVHEKKRRPGKRNNAEPMAFTSFLYPGLGLIALLVAIESADVGGWQIWFVRIVIALLLALLTFVCRSSREVEKVDVAVATWKADGLMQLAPGKTPEELLGGLLARQLPAEERCDRVDAMLKAAGLKSEKGPARSLVWNRLSNDDQRVLQILTCLARRPEVLICEDPLRGLAVDTQARVLRMLKRMKQNCGTSILFFSPDLDQVSYLADSLGLLVAGALCEKGPTDEVLQTPRSHEMKTYIAAHLERISQKKVGGKVQAKCAALFNDMALEGAWIPPKYT